MEDLLLEDENGEILTIRVNHEIAGKARADIVYATQLLHEAKCTSQQLTSQIHETNCTSSEQSTSQVPSSDNAQLQVEQYFTDADTSCFRWSHEAILLLLEEFRKQEEALVSGKISQKRVWQNIAAVMCDKGHEMTGLQCMSKFNGMKKTYKSIKDHNKKSGNNPRVWPYLDLMDSLLGERPFMVPLSTASSSTGICAGAGDSSHNSSSQPSTSQAARPSTRKRKNDTSIVEAIVESRRVAEENKQRRHEDSFKQRQELLECIKKLME